MGKRCQSFDVREMFSRLSNKQLVIIHVIAQGCHDIVTRFLLSGKIHKWELTQPSGWKVF